MVVIILHPTEQLIIERAAQKIIAEKNGDGIRWYPHYPRWVVFEQRNAVDYAAVKAHAAQLIVSNAEANGNALIFPVNIIWRDGTSTRGAVQFAKKCDSSMNAENNTARAQSAAAETASGSAPAQNKAPPTAASTYGFSDTASSGTNAAFPLSCRVFRAAHAVFSADKTSWSVTDSVWIKTAPKKTRH
ncbi:MAG: hypothetical protein IJ191_01095 [Treponema sp.]|nr:hypothetical protein [Treponema sp.]